jgi:hypothetical protein
MDRWAYRRRRISVLVVAIVAGAATIATSQPPLQAHVDGSTPTTVVLSDEAPRAVGRFVLTLSPGTLPVGTSVGPSPKGTVSFVMSGPGGTGAGGNDPVQITAAAVGIATPAQPGPYQAAPSWPIEQLCRIAEPCRREFDVSVEWLQPRPQTSIEVRIAANVALVYDRLESPPPGATATWEAGEFTAAAPHPAVPASVDLGRTTLGRDSPLAGRHVVLRASAALLADPTATDITAYVRSEGTDAQPPQAIVTMVADDPNDQRPADAAALIQPFTGCPRAVECVRGFTVVARWVGTDPDDTVDVDWSFDAIARFGGSAAVPADATLAAEVDERLDLGLASPRIQARVEGSFDLVASGGRKGGRVRLVVTPPPLGNAFFGAAPPAVALVRLRAAVKDPGAPADLLAWISGRSYRSDGSSVTLADDGTELQTIALPLDGCYVTDTCPGSIEIFVESRADRDATISWDVAIELPVPSQVPADGELKIEVASAP